MDEWGLFYCQSKVKNFSLLLLSFLARSGETHCSARFGRGEDRILVFTWICAHLIHKRMMDEFNKKSRERTVIESDAFYTVLAICLFIY